MRAVLLLSTLALLGLAACGRGGHPAHPRDDEPRLEPVVAVQQWYRSPTSCGQGPYELELPVAGARWGEDFELRVRAPRAVELHAIVLADDDEVARASGVFGAGGAGGAAAGGDRVADNARCVADARERLGLQRGGGGAAPPPGSSTGGGVPATPDAAPPTPPAAPPAALELDASLVTSSLVVVRFGWRDRAGVGDRLPTRVRLRFWSIAPNDLEGVLFGVARIEWRPNVPDATYEAHLAARAAAAEDARRRRAEEARQAELAWQARPATRAPAPRRAVAVDAEALLAAERAREEAARRRAIAAALEAERRARRAEFCATHPEDRGCWGAGGLRVHLELERRKQERAAYCADHPEDARCWSPEERGRRVRAGRVRIEAALAPPRAPDGPPPAALIEVVPPRLSAGAEWRPGYWHWTGAAWFWIGGVWRVPERDLVAGTTTVAPDAPPPPQAEAPPPASFAAAVWVPGFWQWSGTGWVWVPGSWQLRPAPRATWRPPTWQARGAVHVLVPGAWIELGAGGR